MSGAMSISFGQDYDDPWTPRVGWPFLANTELALPETRVEANEVVEPAGAACGDASTDPIDGRSRIEQACCYKEASKNLSHRSIEIFRRF